MNASLDRRAPAVSLAAEDPAPALNLHTGYLDDRRNALQPGDARYLVFAHAYRHQHRWDDAQHREFWLTHLGLWPSSGRSRPNREALAFVLALGQSQGFGYREVIDEMPRRAWADLRDRGIPTIATRMLKELTNRTDPPGMPDEEVSSNGSRSLPGPAHPGVVAALRRWRLPRVWADTADGSEEAALPPPLAGHINLPHATGDPNAFKAIGTASLETITQGCAALNRLHARRRRRMRGATQRPGDRQLLPPEAPLSRPRSM